MFKFKRIASVLAGVLMIGSTVALAAAANYPAPFVQSGVSNVAIVYGANAAQTDVVAASDIQSSLSSALSAQTAVSGGTTSSVTASGGDFITLARPSSPLHLGDTTGLSFGRSITNEDLPNLLADGTYQDYNSNTFDYTQKITVDNLELQQFSNNNYASYTPTIGVVVPNNAEILNYTLQFSNDPSSTTALEDTDLTMMGTDYYILSETNDSSHSTTDDPSGNGVNSLTLLDAASSTVLNEGDTKTLTVGNETYTVQISYIDPTQVKFIVNGQTTNTLQNGGTYQLSNGAYLGVKDILSQNYAGGTSEAEFSIGTGKLVIQDGQSVSENDNSIDGLNGYILDSNSQLNEIVLEWDADNTEFITPTSSLTMPGFQGIQLAMTNMTYPGNEETTVQNQGQSDIQLSTVLTSGDVTTDILDANSSGAFSVIGQDSQHHLVTSNNNTLTFNGNNLDEYFPVGWSSGKNAESYVLEVNGFTTNDNQDQATVQDTAAGSTWSQNVQVGDSINLQDIVLTVTALNRTNQTITFSANSGTSFDTLYTASGLEIHLPWVDKTGENLTNLYANTTDIVNTGIAANATAGTWVLNNQLVPAMVPGELAINRTLALAESNASGGVNDFLYNVTYFPTTYNLVMQEADKDGNIGSSDSYPASGAQLNFTLGDVGTNNGAFTDVEVTSIAASRQFSTDGNTSAQGLQEQGSSSDLFIGNIYSPLATTVEYNEAPTQATASLWYHGGESYGSLVLSAPGVVVSTTPGAAGATLGTVVITDAEASQAAGKNLIVVGGSCINSVAASLLGSAACGSDFTAATGVSAGQFLIQTFDNSGGTVATLVAGYNAADTTNAATYLTTQSVSTTTGSSYIGTSSTSATMQTTTTA